MGGAQTLVPASLVGLFYTSIGLIYISNRSHLHITGSLSLSTPPGWEETRCWCLRVLVCLAPGFGFRRSLLHIISSHLHVTRSLLHITRSLFHITRYFLYVTRSILHFTKSLLLVIRSLLHITVSLSHITRSLFIFCMFPGLFCMLLGLFCMSICLFYILQYMFMYSHTIVCMYTQGNVMTECNKM